VQVKLHWASEHVKYELIIKREGVCHHINHAITIQGGSFHDAWQLAIKTLRTKTAEFQGGRAARKTFVRTN